MIITITPMTSLYDEMRKLLVVPELSEYPIPASGSQKISWAKLDPLPTKENAIICALPSSEGIELATTSTTLDTVPSVPLTELFAEEGFGCFGPSVCSKRNVA